VEFGVEGWGLYWEIWNGRGMERLNEARIHNGIVVHAGGMGGFNGIKGSLCLDKIVVDFTRWRVEGSEQS
jgi:hypothetical protein